MSEAGDGGRATVEGETRRRGEEEKRRAESISERRGVASSPRRGVVPPPRRRVALSPRPGLAALRGCTLVLKLGGSVGQEDTLPEDLQQVQAAGARVALVHGGGPLITAWLARIAKETRFVGGLRYTDEETLDVVRMVLGGLVNGEIVARLGLAGVRAIGLSGSDDRLLQAAPRDPALGLVGDVTSVNPAPLRLALDSGYVAVVAPVAVAEGGGFLNVNADTAAAQIALALGANRLIFFTDVDGISDTSGPRRRLDPAEARRLIAAGVVTGGMIPKVDASLLALSHVGEALIVDGRQPHALLDALLKPAALGTTVSGVP